MSQGDLDAAARKADLRQRLRAARAAKSAAELAAASQGIATQAMNLVRGLSTNHIAAYASYANEPPTMQLLTELHGSDVQVLLPILREDLTLDWAVFEGPDEMEPSAKGIPEPTGPRLGPDGVAQASLLFIPALAVDARGNRLGQGVGCYDRALSRYPAGVVVAVVFDDEVLDSPDAIPSEAHDRTVNAALTPERVQWFG